MAEPGTWIDPSQAFRAEDPAHGPPNTWFVMEADAWWAQGALPPGEAAAGRDEEAAGAPRADPDARNSVTLEQIFRVADTDGDGVLSKQEFGEAFRGAVLLAPAPPPSGAPPAAPLPAALAGRRAASLRTGTLHPGAGTPVQLPALLPPAAPAQAGAWLSPATAAGCGDGAARLGGDEEEALTPASPGSGRSLASGSPGSRRALAAAAGMLVNVPPAIAKLMEAIVAEEVSGLGECLNICAQRSRTLKLLGFQHLHYDARLQTFLESRAQGVCRPVLDLLLLTRALLGFREAARHGMLWGRLIIAKCRLKATVREVLDLQQRGIHAAARRTRAQLDRALKAEAEAHLRLAMGGWARAVADARSADLTDRLETAARRQDASDQWRKERREQAIRQRLQALVRAALVPPLHAWSLWATQRRHRELLKCQVVAKVEESDQVLVQDCLWMWGAAVREVRSAQKAVDEAEALRRRQVAAVQAMQANFQSRGIGLCSVLLAWRSIRDQAKLKTRVLSSFDHSRQWVLNATLLAWSEVAAVSRQRREEVRWQARQVRLRRLEAMELTVKRAIRLWLSTALGVWRSTIVYNRLRNKKREQSLRHASRRIEEIALALQAEAFRAWTAHLAAEQRLHMQKALQLSEAAASAAGARGRRATERFLGRTDLRLKQVIMLGWIEAVKDARLMKKRREDIGRAALRWMTDSAEAMQVDCFKAWVSELGQARLRKKLETAAQQAREVAAQLASFEAIAKEHERQSQNRAFIHAARIFQRNTQGDLATTLQCWVTFVRNQKTKAQHVCFVLRAVGTSDLAAVAEAFATWSHECIRARDERAAQALAQEAAELKAAHAKAKQEARERLLKAAAFQLSQAVRDLTATFFSCWHDLVRSVRTRALVKEDCMLRALKSVATSDAQLKGGAFVGWHAASQVLRLERRLGEAQEQMEDLNRQLELTRHESEKHRKWIADAATRTEEGLLRQREQKLAAMWRVCVHSDETMLQLSFNLWLRQIRVQKEMLVIKAKKAAIAARAIEAADTSLLVQCLSGWIRVILQDFHARKLNEAQQSSEEAHALASNRVRMQRMWAMAVMGKQFASSDKQLMANAVDSWKDFWEDSVRRHRAKRRSTAEANRRFADMAELLQAAGFLAWRGIAFEARTSRAASERSAAAHAAAKRFQRTAAYLASERARRRYAAVLLAQCIGGWFLVTCLLQQASEEAGRRSKVLTRDRRYIVRLRNLVLQQRCCAAWKYAVELRKPRPPPQLTKVSAYTFTQDPPIITPPVVTAPPAHTRTLRCGGFVVRPASAGGAARGAGGGGGGGGGEGGETRFVARPMSAGSVRMADGSQVAFVSMEEPGAEGAGARTLEVRAASPIRLQVSPRLEVHTYEATGARSEELALAATAAAVALSPTAQGGLPPAERLALASQAMVSDSGYRRLFQLNRQEIRDRAASPPPTQWGVWAM